MCDFRSRRISLTGRYNGTLTCNINEGVVQVRYIVEHVVSARVRHLIGPACNVSKSIHGMRYCIRPARWYDLRQVYLIGPAYYISKIVAQVRYLIGLACCDSKIVFQVWYLIGSAYCYSEIILSYCERKITLPVLYLIGSGYRVRCDT